MTKNPDFHYSDICLNGIMKDIPILQEADPEMVALRLYQDASAFATRDGRCICGGGEDDIKALVSAASGAKLSVCAAREIKDALSEKLRIAWSTNDHATIYYVACGFERNASMAIVDVRDVYWADPCRFQHDDDDQDGFDIPEAVEEWLDTLCEPIQARTVIGNRSRKRKRRKSSRLIVESLFGEAV